MKFIETVLVSKQQLIPLFRVSKLEGFFKNEFPIKRNI
ncbi:hypothetical protein RV18_GL003162 [Enterococcus termitis]|nr:hypothetical protein RV18_GL003162 [Enterococcus termitis]